jgi:hypothetical protein
MTETLRSQSAANAIRGLHNEVLEWKPALMSESLDRLLRRCDAKLPLVAPSFFDAAATEQRWLAFLRAEELRANTVGTAMEQLGLVVRRALRDPRCKKLEEVVARWLPDEDPLREVVISSRDAVQAFWREPSKRLTCGTLRLLSLTRGPHEQWRSLIFAAIALARPLLGDEATVVLRDGLDRARDTNEALAIARDALDVLLRRGGDQFTRSVFGDLVYGEFPGSIGLIVEQFDARVRAEVERACGVELLARYPTLDLELVWRTSAGETSDRPRSP